MNVSTDSNNPLSRAQSRQSSILTVSTVVTVSQLRFTAVWRPAGDRSAEEAAAAQASADAAVADAKALVAAAAAALGSVDGSVLGAAGASAAESAAVAAGSSADVGAKRDRSGQAIVQVVGAAGVEQQSAASVAHAQVGPESCKRSTRSPGRSPQVWASLVTHVFSNRKSCRGLSSQLPRVQSSTSLSVGTSGSRRSSC